MVDYNKRQDVTVEEFKECVETCLPNLLTLHDELQRGNSINKAACKQILDNLHTKYIPNNLELFLWKNIGNVEENKNSFLVSIKGWTVKDVEKRTLAKINHLNFKEFFNLKQFYSWFNSL